MNSSSARNTGLRKAVDLRHTARRLYKAMLPDIRRYEAAKRQATKALEKSAKGVVSIKCKAPDVFTVCMLHGLALENIFKAALVNQNPHLIDRNKISPKLLKHNLTKLAEAANISLSNNEKQILDWLTEVVVWQVRYQVPTNSRQLGIFWAMDHTIGENIRSFNKTVDTVFKRVEATLKPNVPKSRYR
ncbi:MAG: hypothetical protein WA743_02340 [Pseudolabrys sp.]